MDAKLTGQRIVQLRKEKGLTQNDLSQTLHVSIAAVSKWERGLNFPDLTLLEPLAEALDTTAAELLGIENAPVEEVIRDMAAISEQTKAKGAFGLLFRMFFTMVLLVAMIPLNQLMQNVLNDPVLQQAVGNLLWPLGFGLISWILGCASLIAAKHWQGLSCLSWAFCALAMYFPVSYMDYLVKQWGLSGIEDTAWGWHWGAVVLLTGTVVLSIGAWLIHNIKLHKKGSTSK